MIGDHVLGDLLFLYPVNYILGNTYNSTLAYRLQTIYQQPCSHLLQQLPHPPSLLHAHVAPPRTIIRFLQHDRAAHRDKREAEVTRMQAIIAHHLTLHLHHRLLQLSQRTIHSCRAQPTRDSNLNSRDSLGAVLPLLQAIAIMAVDHTLEAHYHPAMPQFPCPNQRPPHFQRAGSL